MKPDKQIKKEFKLKASKDPDKYYATGVLKSEGFERKKCRCGTYFWTVNKKQKTCGDPSCSGGFRFFESTPTKKTLDYAGVWKEFSKMFRSLGYTPIKRYPLVARWNPTMEYTIASIAAFQPYVVSGEVSPPANPLVIPQFCLRFGDVDNVGITGSHMTGFVMIGQHMFVKPDEWDQEKVFRDIYRWITEGIGLDKSEVTFHEDAWAGGGNFGPCMEFFSRGVELGNQVYMMYEQTPDGDKELGIKVLDMGMGHERVAWFMQGTSTIYDAVFPSVLKKLRHATKLEADPEIIKKFVPYAGYLNIDEVEDIDKAWKEVASKAGMDVLELKMAILPSAALYSIGEHTRSLLVALSDGALPSNVGGGYNLRMLIRRCLGFMEKYGWNLDLGEICSWHAEELKELFPELSENLETVKKILEVEKDKYETTKQKSKQIVENLVKRKEKVSTEKLLELYDSQGIDPQLIKESLEKEGISIKVPDNFYALVSERHEKKEQVHSTLRKIDVDFSDLPETKALYFDDYTRTRFDATVLRFSDKYLVLDQTCFYPTSGGQLHDIGSINGVKVTDVFKQGSIIVHEMESGKFIKGEKAKGEIDFERRQQLAQHHTATHIVNAAAKRVLGMHVNQAGAKKTKEKAHLDITHYQSINDEELKQIEDEANKIVCQELPIKSCFMKRDTAEKKFGMEIYQGGAVPGKMLRIIEIPTVDVEACGGTHLHTTLEAGKIKILKSNKIQDGVVRITFTAGKASEEAGADEESIIKEVSKLLGVEKKYAAKRVEELFAVWKKAKKAAKKGKELDSSEVKLNSKEECEEDQVSYMANVLKTQPEHIVKTVKRFISEIDEMDANR